MNEITLQWIAIFKLLCVVIYAGLYGFGGTIWKPLRRFIGSFFITLAIVLFSIWTKSFSWLYVLVFPLLAGFTSIGYGVNSIFTKVFKNKFVVRAVAGLGYACASLPIAVVSHNWTLWLLHTALCIIVSMIMGAMNPVIARYEETIIGTIIVFLPMFM